MKQLVSIIVPCFNQVDFLDESLGSIRNQTYKNWECLIVNDGSTDATEQVAKKWVGTDNRFRYIKKKNAGTSSAKNTGLEKSRGDYIQFLDCDDWIHRDKIQLSIREFSNDPLVDIVISNFQCADVKLNRLVPPYCKLEDFEFNLKSIVLDWDNGYTIPLHCGFFRSEFFKAYRFNEELHALEDWEMWIKYFLWCRKSFFIDRSLVIYRMHTNSATKDKKKMYLARKKFLALVESEGILKGDLLIQFLKERKLNWLKNSEKEYLKEKYPLLKYYSKLRNVLRRC